MSPSLSRGATRTAVAIAGLVASGVGLAGVASAAPTASPSPASSAPSSADPAPQRPALSDAPVPFVFQPVDASDGLFGVRRGSVPTASTPGMSQLPVARRMPAVDITPLPGDDQQ